MITVNRKKFILWSQGKIMEFKKGKGIINEDKSYYEAQKAMDRGETIKLCDGDRETFMCLTEVGYKEYMMENKNG